MVSLKYHFDFVHSVPPGARENDSKINYHHGLLPIRNLTECSLYVNLLFVSLWIQPLIKITIGSLWKPLDKMMWFLVKSRARVEYSPWANSSLVSQRWYVPRVCLVQISSSQDFRRREGVTRCPGCYCLPVCKWSKELKVNLATEWHFF